MCNLKDAVVLVIDDCEDNLFLFGLILGGDGYRVEKANCGQEGICKIQELVPDLIILDMMMPDMTGLEVIKQVRSDARLSHIPIILCTANTYIQKEEVKEVEDVFYKPIDIVDMLTKINSLVACCDNTNSQTMVMDLDDNEPICSQQKQLLTDLSSGCSTRPNLQIHGHEMLAR